MEFDEVVKKRYSVRKYDPRPVEDWKIERILEAGRLAPTGKNSQCQRVYVLRSPEALDKIRANCSMTFDAPLVLLVFAKKDEAWVSRFTSRNIAETDTSIVTDHMMLAAVNLGLGTCWVGYFDPVPICDSLGIPNGLTLMHVLPVGYPAEDSEPYPMHFERKDLSETVTFL